LCGFLLFDEDGREESAERPQAAEGFDKSAGHPPNKKTRLVRVFVI
jgi:hypothetical protein